MSEHSERLIDPILQRRSPRAFAEREPSGEQLRLLFEAARWAASSFNSQPWRYIVVRRSEGAPFEDALAGLVPANQAWAQAAPVIGFSLARTHFANGKTNRHAWHDVGAASAQLSIQAASMGLMVHQMGGIDPEVVRERFAVPAELDVVAGFVIGWPGDPASLAEPLRERELAPRSREPLDTILFRGPLGP